MLSAKEAWPLFKTDFRQSTEAAGANLTCGTIVSGTSFHAAAAWRVEAEQEPGVNSAPIPGFDLDALARVTVQGRWAPAPPLPVKADAPRRRLSICVASPDLVGPVRNGGIGTAYTALAEALAADGHRVTALYLSGQYCEQRTLGDWASWYLERGVEFIPLPAAAIPLNNSPNVNSAYDAYQWLRGRPFDVIHFPEWKGLAYWCLLARRQDLAFAETTFVLGIHSSTAWQRQGNQELITCYTDLESDYLERRCVELADVVWSPSQYLLRWARDRDWKFPANTYVQPYLAPDPVGPGAGGRSAAREAIVEVVFFGRLEERKGIVLFCDALEILAAQHPQAACGLHVTFLGKEMSVRGVPSREYLAGRAGRLPFPTQVITDKNRFAALEYLRGAGRLAVMPSLMENLPFTVIECLREGAPFLASTAGGIPELIAAGQRERLLAPLRADLWAAALARVLAEGAERGRLAFDPEVNRRAWLDWHAQLAPGTGVAFARHSPAASTAPRPLVSICIPHHNHAQLLAQTIDSLRKQDYPNLEVVLVDDASTDLAARDYLNGLEAEFAARGWRLERSRVGRFATGARNAAARLARGEYLLFMDDDDVARPHEVSTLAAVAAHTGADLVGCLIDVTDGAEPPGRDRALSRWAYLGPAVALGLWHNALGGAHTLMRRRAFLDLGGFTEDYGVGHEDHELVVRAVLRGYRLEIVPEALVWRRRAPASLHQGGGEAVHLLRALRPYLEAVPAELRPALQLAQGLHVGGSAPAPPPPCRQPLRYKAADWVILALAKQPGYSLAKSVALWSARNLKRFAKRLALVRSQRVGPGGRRKPAS
jgi:glycosyltransferase involved in cell wall biosynthesis/GT2 family glycosyltransferase